MSNFYLPGTMHVDIEITYRENMLAYNYLFDKDTVIKNLSKKSKDEVFEKSIIASVQEHEFFHHRHSCSVTYGYLSFIVNSLGLTLRQEIAKLFPKPTVKDVLFDFSKYKKIDLLKDPLLYFVFRCRAVDLLLTSFENLDFKVAESIISTEELINKYFKIYLPKSIPTEKEYEKLRGSLSCTEILEAIACWKQYNWSSLIWYGGQSPYAQELEKEWISWLALNNPVYLNTANYIHSRCKVALNNSLFGIILNLSLNPPIFTKEIKSWTEFSPRLRLEAILEICNNLPKKYIERDYLEFISQDEYIEIVNTIEEELGWYKSNDIIRDALEDINSTYNCIENLHQPSNLGSTKYLGKIIHTRLVHSYNTQFQHGLLNNMIHPGYMLFPWFHSMSSYIGDLVRPIATQYFDKLCINTMRLEDEPNKSFVYDPVGVFILLQDMTENIWLLETFNQNIEQKQKAYARQFYKRIPNAMKTHFNYSNKVKNEVNALLINWKTFEQFMSKRLNKDYSTCFIVKKNHYCPVIS